MKDVYHSGLKLLCLVVGSFLAVTAAQAQTSGLVDEWPLGRVYLASGDSLNGKITYHRTEDLVQVTRPDGSTLAYAPVAVKGFEAVDDGGRYRRVFVTQRWNHGNDYSDFLAPSFFEQIILGKYVLMRRETMTRRDISRDPMYRRGYYPGYGGYGYGGYPYGMGGMGGPIYVDQRADSFFLMLPSGKVRELRNVKKDMESIFGKQKGKMKSYIKQNKLKYTELPDLAKIVSYFNTIS